uniref:Ribosomal protein L7Ae/L30e/S12e/Gadd45 domain-containing protein n=1 Tax=Panagrolaimus sp. JU765 TaxID=591449 RepID=A0AC34QA89_9BILA
MVEVMDDSVVESGPSTDREVYAELCTFVNAISQPLANRKLAKKLYKLVQKAAADKKSIRQGVSDVLKALRKKEKGIVILAGNVSPIDIYSHLPVLCEDKGIPYVFTPSREHLGLATGHRRPAIVLMVLKSDEYADLYDEVHEIVNNLVIEGV